MTINWNSFLAGLVTSAVLIFLGAMLLFENSNEPNDPLYGRLNLIPDKDAYFQKIEKICIEKGVKDSIKSENKLTGATYSVDSIEVRYDCDTRKSIDLSYFRKVNDTTYYEQITLRLENNRYDYGDGAFLYIIVPGKRDIKREMSQTEIYTMLDRVK